MLFYKLPDRKKCIRGEYENKICFESNIEKIFEVFANVVRDKGVYMSYFDMLRSIVGFNYTMKTKEELLSISNEIKKNSIIEYFDIDKSGDISIEEYIFFLTFYYLKDSQIKSFEDNKVISKENFRNIYEKVKQERNICLTSINFLDSRLKKISDEFKLKEEEFINKFFQNKEEKKVEDILNFKKKMSTEIESFRVGLKVSISN